MNAPPSATVGNVPLAAGTSESGPSAATPTAAKSGGASPKPAAGAWLAEEDRPRSRNANARGGGLIPPTPEDVVRASLARATGPSFGTIILAALVLSLLRLATIMAWCARRVSKAIARSAERPIALGMDDGGIVGGMGRFVASRGLSIWLQPVGHGAAVLAGLTAVAESVSEYALVYTGVTGEAFWKGARRAGRLVGRHGVKGVMDGPSRFLSRQAQASYPPYNLRKKATSNHLHRGLARLLKHELTEIGARVVNRGGTFFCSNSVSRIRPSSVLMSPISTFTRPSRSRTVAEDPVSAQSAVPSTWHLTSPVTLSRPSEASRLSTPSLRFPSVRQWAYIKQLGWQGLKSSTEVALLNANY
ncbi:hypothetical protein CF326_g9647, partial [Tilletia indica]